ncbi:hypothetical protein [Paenibacillus xylanilyticus]|uniref:Uncharacterized protein n=1 Tax=Paenibacillus xylanilyticus TaxID=248903 RepID=A0A7Y6C034_9BACL|nr:hypothetical protein [Paenibacillus xylanilyticus]NUU77991.1 hypothetical protein [Paenibacillus xylanilyticus]
MKNKRRELRKQHNEICRKILDATDKSLIMQLQAKRKKIEGEIQKSEGGPIVSKKKFKSDIGNCPLCFQRIKYGESYVQAGKLKFCNDRHRREYAALINEK